MIFTSVRGDLLGHHAFLLYNVFTQHNSDIWAFGLWEEKCLLPGTPNPFLSHTRTVDTHSYLKYCYLFILYQKQMSALLALVMLAANRCVAHANYYIFKGTLWHFESGIDLLVQLSVRERKSIFFLKCQTVPLCCLSNCFSAGPTSWIHQHYKPISRRKEQKVQGKVTMLSC